MLLKSLFRVAVALALVITAREVAAQVAPAHSAAQPGVPDRAMLLNGAFTVQAGAQDCLREAVERAVAPMNFVLRPVARRRLLALNQPSNRIEIEVRGDSVLIRYANQPELRAQRRGASRSWQNAAGERLAVEVRAPLASADSVPLLSERYTAEDGTRENRWFIDSATGQLRLEVNIASPRLPSPMRLQLSYNRAADSQLTPR